MSLNKALRYPGRWNAPTTEYPMGVPKNRTSDTAKDGTYFEKDWLAEHEAFFGALMNEAGFSPNGDVDTAEASQFFDALSAKVNGETSFSTNGYHKMPGGLILQWGASTVNLSSVSTVNYPVPFPSVSLMIIANDTKGSPLSDGNTGLIVLTHNKSRTQFEAVIAGSTGADLYSWFAIGY